MWYAHYELTHCTHFLSVITLIVYCLIVYIMLALGLVWESVVFAWCILSVVL